MSKRLYPHNRVRYWYAYDLDEICGLFADTNLHPQTVRKWMKNGMSAIDTGKPTLIYGHDLIAFLKNHNQANKCQTAFDEFFCMSCKDARPVFQNHVSAKQKAKFLQVQGVCRECKSKMFKNYKLVDFPALKKKFKVVGVSQLYDCEKPTLKTHLQHQDKTLANESSQGELFSET